MKLIFKSQILVFTIILAWIVSVNVYSQDHSFGVNPNPPRESVGQMPIQDNITTVTTISHSTSMTVVSGSSVACGYTGVNVTTDNSFYRSFVLSNFGITTAWTVTKVTIGIEDAYGPDQPLTCNLYTTSQPFPGGFPGSLTLIGSKTLNVAAQSLTLLEIPIIATAPAGSELVVEIALPDGYATSNGFWIGANGLGQTAPSYLKSDSCGISTPVTTAAIGFPNSMWVMSVTGTTELFFDNFDSYTAGQQLACQTTNWTTWSNAPCTGEDPYVSTAYAYSGANSVKIVPVNDCVRTHGNKTTGKWYISFMFYIPAGKGGYFNTLNTFPTPGTSSHYGMDAYFNSDGTAELDTGGTVNFTWQAATWTQVMVVIDLDSPTRKAEFWIGAGNLTQIATWNWTRWGTTYAKRIAANDFYGPTQTSTDEMYFDDYYFSDVMPPIQQLANDVGTLSIDLASQIGPGTIAPKATVKNYGTAANSFNVQMTITGLYSSTKTVTNLAAGATQQVTFDNWNPTTTGIYAVSVCTQLGTDQDNTNDCKAKDVYVWDASGDWTTGAVNPINVYLGTGVGYTNGAQKYLFSIAGITPSGIETECYKYDVTANSWSTIAPLPFGRDRLASALVGDFIYAIGGYDTTGAGVVQSSVFKYDIVGNSWSTVAPLPVALGWGRAVNYNNYIYVAGGVITGSVVVATVYVYNTTTNTWATATSMPGPKFGGGFSIVGNKLVFAAGAADVGISNTVYVGTIDAGNPALISWATMMNPYPGIKEQVYSNYLDLTGKIVSHLKGKDRSPEAVAYPPGAMYRFEAEQWGSDAIIVAGGSPSSTWVAADPNPCYIYKPATDTWIAQENVTNPTTAASTGSVYDGSTWKLILTGGINNLGALTNTTRIYTQTLAATTFPLSVTITNGWNMVSIPGLHPTNQNVSTWWPGLTGTVWGFNGIQYVAKAIATPGEGYWMKHVGATVYNYPAIQIVAHTPLNALSGWNMIGGYENSVATIGLVTSPPNQITGTIWGFNGVQYVAANTLVPGYSYWVKLLPGCPCTITIPEALSKGTEAVELFKEDWGRIILTDASGLSYTLYAVKGEVDLDQYEMPPMPPAGMFDIRFSSGRIAEDINSSIQTIDMSGIEYPLTVRVEGMDIRLQDVTGKQINLNLKSGEEIVISDATINKLMVSGELIPDKYALEQNYPNPFNPSTIIEFSLPENVGNVKLSIYNALGEKVAELVNTALTAGKYSYQWNAQNVATGMYIYELRTDKFVSVKKMIFLK